MGAKKPRIVMQLLEEREVDGVVLSDTDVVWLRRPHEFFAQHKAADVLVSTDCLSHQVSPGPLKILEYPKDCPLLGSD